MLRFQQIITDEQLADPTIKAQLLELQLHPEWRRNMFGTYCDRKIVAPVNDWDSELFIVFDDQEDDQPIGMLNPQLDRFNSLVRGLCPAVFPDFRNEGYATEMFKWAFQRYRDLGFNRIQAHAYGYNQASLKLCRNFFKEERVEREAIRIDGKFCDRHYFGILCREIDFSLNKE
jgi:RimJ/RimL family protein N-acetyltransferase